MKHADESSTWKINSDVKVCGFRLLVLCCCCCLVLLLAFVFVAYNFIVVKIPLSEKQTSMAVFQFPCCCVS